MKVKGADPHVLYDKKSGYYYCYATSGDTDFNKYFYEDTYFKYGKNETYWSKLAPLLSKLDEYKIFSKDGYESLAKYISDFTAKSIRSYVQRNTNNINDACR